MDWLNQLQLEAQWWWLILAVLLGIGEIISPGVFLIWVAAAAAFTGLVTILTGVPPAAQLLIFAATSLVSAWFGRRWYLGNPVQSADPLLNDRAARLIGRTVTVAEPIVHGRGRVTVGDSVWPATGPDLPKGAAAQVTGVSEGVLVVGVLE
ncbi:NfeD family protein [Rhizorhapis sp.]|uniref:NfeD family protein n=1 Tax=Rhizorhapis sp. TaxID=1968842 RepID=UPI002B4804BF|nr:NfeD family protein [Rhizorhapis sp.]HKR18312.1 NfeD family protein [Rhizorhapis sp.]HKX36047.1 NfeD family protein [Rhizorhapis sp.]